MPNAVFRSFARFEDARRARDELIASGFPASAVELRSLEDEAGPVAGNFTVGDGRPARGSRDRYERNFADSASSGTNLLVVSAQDETQRERAEVLLAALGGSRAGTA